MIPLLLKFTLGFGSIASQFFVGPYLSAPIGQLEQNVSGYGSDKLDFSPSPGIMLGTSFGVKLGPGLLFFDGRYATDFVATTVDGNDAYNRSKFLFSLGYEFGLGAR
jgi:hypothetical protein